MLRHFQELIENLNEAGVRYLVCGGLAVVAHGHVRVTHDIDLALALDQSNLRSALRLFEALGFNPLLPVKITAFADPSIRERWETEKGMQVFSLTAPSRQDLVIDLFCRPPFDFEEEWNRSEEVVLGPEFPPCRVVSLPTLRTMKSLAGRPIDLDDLNHLPTPPDERKT